MQAYCSCCRIRELDVPNQRYCQHCRARYMREWRVTHRLSGEARRRANARAYAHVYVKRGKLERKPCEVCGDPSVQVHHKDYSRPLDVSWLCKVHHQELHRRCSAPP